MNDSQIYTDNPTDVQPKASGDSAQTAQTPVEPPKAPQAPNPPIAPPPAPQMPRPPYNFNPQPSYPQNTYQGNIPPAGQQFNGYQPPYYNAPYRVPQPQPKNNSNTGLKVLVAVVITLLIACIAGLTSYIALNPRSDGFVEVLPAPTEEFTIPPSEIAPDVYNSVPDKEYPESNAKDKINADFKGIELKKKPTQTTTTKTTKKSKKSKNTTEIEYGSSYAFKNVEKSVVGIICYVDGQEGTADSYTSMGSGVVLTSDGYILTNSHLVGESRTAYKFKVITDDKKEYKAGVVGFDSRSDLAVLKIDAKGLSPATFGDSDEIEVTEDVIVVGNPRSLSYQNSVTKGIVSAVNRKTSMRNNVKYIQTDAAINPGNSGGAMCNMYGQVIGISNSKIALEEYEGMCFAIPSRTVKSVADDIIRNGFVTGRVKIGITGTVVMLDDTGKTGIEIAEIGKGGPLDGTDAQAGDVVLAIDGKATTDFSAIYDILEEHKAGDEVEITVYQSSTSKEIKFKIKLQADEN
ncbi:MAG: trypsin-like peptidase domain-containing protein [Ruminococcus sp.]|nr:trypsin-like peptidase domain-containing protein [Ruminococcus sp.]